ncbi:MAG: hypothetical protein AAGJ18_18290, partial [Bacteroidota bacterium]
EISIHADFPKVPKGDTLRLEVWATDPVFISSVSTNLGINQAMAITCPREGQMGLKFPVQSVSVTSNQDFDDDHPAGTPLNDLFIQRAMNLLTRANETLPLVADGFLDAHVTNLLLTSMPTLKRQHIFTLTFEKANGEVITGRSTEISWE